MKRLFDPDEWNLTLPRRALPERAKRMPLLIPAATVLAVAAVGVIVGLVFATGVRSPDIRPAVPVPSPTTTPTLENGAIPDDGRVLVSEFAKRNPAGMQEAVVKLEGHESLPWAVIVADGTTLSIGYVIGAGEGPPCGTHLGVDIEQTETSVTIAVVGDEREPDVLCNENLNTGAGVVTLDAPLGNRVLMHAAVSPPWTTLNNPFQLVEPVAPLDNVQGATCGSLLGTRYPQLVDDGQGMSDGYTQSMSTQPGQQPYDVIMEGGLVCGMATAPCCDISLAYSWGPVSAHMADNLKTELDRGDYVKIVENGITYYRWDQNGLTDGYAFWDGYWASASNFGGGDVLDDVVRNAPGSPLLEADLYLTSEGLGDLRIGQSIPSSSALVTWIGDYCGDYGGAWIATGDYENRFLVFTEGGKKNGKLTRIAVLSNSIPTKSGVRVGMTIAELQQVFPTFDDVIVNIGNHYIIEGTNGEVSFDEALGASAPLGQIFSIQVLEIGGTLGHYESTDGGGNCPA
jgi:hypothetical protein